MFINASIFGCKFHHGQACVRQLDEKGLRNAYREDGRVQSYLKLLFALPYLPEEHIREAFRRLSLEATPDLLPYVQYFEDTWVKHWGPQSWCCFQEFVRTNNDVEGWHTRLHTLAGNISSLDLYLLIDLLHGEALKLPLTCVLVEEEKLVRRPRSSTKALNALLTESWAALESGSLTTLNFLKKIRDAAAPANI